MRRLLSIVTISASLVALPATSQQPADAPTSPRDPGLSASERVDELGARVAATQQRLDRLTADFVQRKASELLVEPEVARGHLFYQAPDRVRWEYESPNPMQVVIDGDEMLTWYEDIERAERMAIGRYSKRAVEYMAAGGTLEELEQHFSLRVAFPDDPEKPYRVELTPRYDRLADRIERVTIWIHPELYVPQRLRYTAADGGVTEYAFDNLRINPELADGTFELDLPTDVEVTRIDLGHGR